MTAFDRYKASSYAAYNFKLPERYDSSLVTRLCGVSRMDDAVVEELEGDIQSLSVLDVGCATGRLLGRLARAGAAKLAGTDLAPRILDVARAKLTEFGAEPQLRAADCEDHLPWDSTTFDVVTMTGVLHHFYRPHPALSEIRRVLKPGGRLILVDPCFFTPVRQVFNIWLLVHPHDGDYHFYTPAKAERLFDGDLWTGVRSQRINWCYFSVKAFRSR